MAERFGKPRMCLRETLSWKGAPVSNLNAWDNQ